MQTTPQPILNLPGVAAALGNVCSFTMWLKELNYSVKYLFHIQIFSKPATLKADSLKQTFALWFQQLLFPVVTINSLEKGS